MTMIERMIGAAKLDAATYEEVEADQSAISQALIVVILAAVAGGIGAIGDGVTQIFMRLAMVLIGWVVWATLTWLVGTKLLAEPQTHADLGQMLRVLGFAYVPQLLLFLAFIPILGWLIAIAVFFWTIACFVVAVRQGLDYTSTGKAVLVVLIAFVGYVLVACVLGSIFGIGAAGLGALTS
jgi:hypothetical protein